MPSIELLCYDNRIRNEMKNGNIHFNLKIVLRIPNLIYFCRFLQKDALFDTEKLSGIKFGLNKRKKAFQRNK